MWRHGGYPRDKETMYRPQKVILFEELSISTFQKHIVFICTDVSGQSYDGVKMALFGKVGIWDLLDAMRDLRNPRKKRLFLTPKSVFPLQALKPLQIWAQTAQWALRTVLSKWPHQKKEIRKKIVPQAWYWVLNLAWGLIYVKNKFLFYILENFIRVLKKNFFWARGFFGWNRSQNSEKL